MNWTTTLPFILDNVDGDLKIVYTPLAQKFYQNGQVIKKMGFSFGAAKYKVQTTDGGDNIVSVKGSLKSGRQILFRGETISLETPLTGLALALAFLPFIAVIIVAVIFAGSGFGFIGGAVLGGTGAFGMLTAGIVLRNEKDTTKQIIYSIVISVISVVLCLVLSFILGLIFGTIFGIAYSIF